MPIYRMTRNGEFFRSENTPNQCKVKGHMRYEYQLVLVFDPRLRLDKDGFIIDHAELDDCIKKLELSGSCEEMHKHVFSGVRKLMRKKSIPLRGYKAIIKPFPAGQAHMEYLWSHSPRYEKLLLN